MPYGTIVLTPEEARRQRNISLEEIARRTKISTQFLAAIEMGEFEKLPGGVFSTNFIRQYAEAVGIPDSELLSQYDAFVQSRLQADSDQQAQCEARRGWTLRCMNWLRTFPAARTEY